MSEERSIKPINRSGISLNPAIDKVHPLEIDQHFTPVFLAGLWSQWTYVLEFLTPCRNTLFEIVKLIGPPLLHLEERNA